MSNKTPKKIRCSAVLDAAEVKAALLSTLPYYEADDKDDYHYLVKERDIDKAVETIVAAARTKASNNKISGEAPRQ